MSYETIIVTDAPIESTLQILRFRKVIQDELDNPKDDEAFYFESSDGTIVTICADPKADVDELETWIAIDETQEGLINNAFQAVQELPYRCRRGATISSSKDVIVVPPNAKRPLPYIP